MEQAFFPQLGNFIFREFYSIPIILNLEAKAQSYSSRAIVHITLHLFFSSSKTDMGWSSHFGATGSAASLECWEGWTPGRAQWGKGFCVATSGLKDPTLPQVRPKSRRQLRPSPPPSGCVPPMQGLTGRGSSAREDLSLPAPSSSLSVSKRSRCGCLVRKSQKLWVMSCFPGSGLCLLLSFFFFLLF